MTVRHYIILILCLGLSVSGFSQKGDKKVYKSKQPQSERLLDQARAIKDKSPTKAIKLVEQAISASRSKKKNRRTSNSEAYILLGNIYEQIEQYDLALQRYEQAFNDFSKKDMDERAEVLYFMGRVLLKQGKLDDAANNFNACIGETYDKTLKIKCEEGLADIEILRKDTSAVVALLDSIDASANLDSLTFARNEARRSQVLLQQNNYSEASEKFKNSLNSIPKNKDIDKSDYAPIQQAQDELLNYKESSAAEKIEVQSSAANNAARNFSTETQVSENLKIAELYEAEANFPEAEKFIAVSKALIDPNTDAAITAKIYKKSSDLNQRKGEVEAALDDLEKYIAAKEIAIRNEEQELKTQVEIVKGQKQIDIRQKDYDIEDKDQALLESQLKTQQVIIGLLSLVLLGSLVFFYFLYKNVKAKRKANQMLLLKSLRTQMNPHFIFNALNSVNNFIAKNDEKAANKFLSEFSKLMRKVLDYSQKDFISFEEEVELNQLYLKLEHYRFRDKFEYTFENEAQQNGFNVDVPPMLIQPFIENAVWHGLRYKETLGQLKVKINSEAGQLLITIEDNGIGRAKSKALKTTNQKQYKSTGLDNVSKRIALINEIYSKNYKIEVNDQDANASDVGTIVKIWIPTDH